MTQILKPDQHREGALYFAVKMHLVMAEPLQLVGNEGRFTIQWPVCKLLLPGDVPGQDFASEIPLQALGIGRGQLLVFFQLVLIARSRTESRWCELPPCRCIFPAPTCGYGGG